MYISIIFNRDSNLHIQKGHPRPRRAIGVYMGFPTRPAVIFIKKYVSKFAISQIQGKGGGIFKKNIIYICIVVSSDKEGKWSFFIALVHARLGSARPCMRYFV